MVTKTKGNPTSVGDRNPVIQHLPVRLLAYLTQLSYRPTLKWNFSKLRRFTWNNNRTSDSECRRSGVQAFRRVLWIITNTDISQVLKLRIWRRCETLRLRMTSIRLCDFIPRKITNMNTSLNCIKIKKHFTAFKCR